MTNWRSESRRLTSLALRPFVIHHTTRAAHIADITTNPNEKYMVQVARNPTDRVNGSLRGMQLLVVGRTEQCDETADSDQ
ncbi:MAG: hypothetical protein ACI9SE_003590 [Neolewinella sp.]